MSAWVVDKVHIDLLVRVALDLGCYDRSGWPPPMQWWQTDEQGHFTGWRVLDPAAVSECVRSVHHRYPGDDLDKGELPGPLDAYWMGPYIYEDPGYVLTTAELFKAIDCLAYQSCEHEEWEASEACSFLRFLRTGASSRTPGYDESPWGWDAEDLATAKERINA